MPRGTAGADRGVAPGAQHGSAPGPRYLRGARQPAAALAPIRAGRGAQRRPDPRGFPAPGGPASSQPRPAAPSPAAIPGPFPRSTPLTAAAGPQHSRYTRGPCRGRAVPAQPARPAPLGPCCGQHGRAGAGAEREAGTAEPVLPGKRRAVTPPLPSGPAPHIRYSLQCIRAPTA